MNEPLPAGPELDRRVGEAMGAEPVGWAVYKPRVGNLTSPFKTYALAEVNFKARFRECADYAADTSVIPVFPTYSAPSPDGTWQACIDWLEAQGHSYRLCHLNPGDYCLDVLQGERWYLTGRGPTRALAVCRAVLLVKELADQSPA